MPLGEFWGSRFEGLEFTLKTIDFFLSFGVLTVLFAVLFQRLPDIDIPWRDVWLGSAVTSLLFTLGKFAIGLYLGKSAVAASYGGAGPLVILLLWIYYSSLIFFFGAEFTQVYSRTYGSRIGKPAEALAENPARSAGAARTESARNPAGATPVATPMPLPRTDWTRERLRAQLVRAQPEDRHHPAGWGPIVFGGGLILTAVVLGARLLRR